MSSFEEPILKALDGSQQSESLNTALASGKWYVSTIFTHLTALHCLVFCQFPFTDTGSSHCPLLLHRGVVIRWPNTPNTRARYLRTPWILVCETGAECITSTTRTTLVSVPTSPDPQISHDPILERSEGPLNLILGRSALSVRAYEAPIT